MRAAERTRGRENVAREGEGKSDMQMWSSRLRRGRKSQRNGVGVGNIRGQRDRKDRINKPLAILSCTLVCLLIIQKH